MEDKLKKLVKDIYTLLPITPEDAAYFVIALRNGVEIRRIYETHVHLMSQQELEEYIKEVI